MLILGIETSCDETAASVVEIKGGVPRVLSNVVSSQIKIHKKYGGVVPEVAARKHSEVIYDVIERAITSASSPCTQGDVRRGANFELKNPPSNSPLDYKRGEQLGSSPLDYKRGELGEIDLIAVTEGPGLITSLRIGVLSAQAIATLKNIPLVGVNHIEAHLLSSFLTPLLTSPRVQGEEQELFPALGLIVSGGHTELVLIKGFGKYKLIGETRDDAVGEAYDKVAKMLNLGYPGGPAISKIAESYKLSAVSRKLALPRPMLNSENFDFSFSGLKTAVLYLTKKMKKQELKKMTPGICKEFQDAVIEVITKKTARAAEKYKVKSILVGGGVSANKELRNKLRKLNYPVFVPEMEYTGDNAAMIAYAGWKKYESKKKNEVFKIKATSAVSFKR